MRRGEAAFLFVLALAASLLSISSVPPALAGSTEGEISEIGWLRVTSEPPGLVVLVGGDSVGVTPLAEAPLDAGRHHVTVVPAGRRIFSTSVVSQEVEIKPGETSELFFRYPRAVTITSTPFGASAYLGERFVGRTPFIFELSEAESDTLELRLAGHDPLRVPVQTLNAAGPRWSVVLAAKTDAPAPVPVTRIGSRGWPWWRYGLIAGAGAGAVLGVALKVQADQAYDDYKTTGNLARQRSLLDRSQRFDDYSLVSWVSAEVFLGTALALLIRDQVFNRKPLAAAEEAK